MTEKTPLKKIVAPYTLHLKKPFGSVLVQAVLLAALLIGGLAGSIELISRTPWAVINLPAPSLGTTNPEFDVKVDRITRLIRAEGPVDCLLLGSSTVDGEIDPVIVEQIYYEKTGQKINCFNFGISTLTFDTAGPVVQSLVNTYHPKFILFGTSIRAFSDEFGGLARPLVSSEWVRYHLGEPTMSGWMIDNLAAYRYYLTMKDWENPENRPVMMLYQREVDAHGYHPKEGHYTFDPNTQQVLIKDLQIQPEFFEGFAQVVALNRDQTHLVMIEMPVQPVFLPYYVEGGTQAYEDQFVKPVQSYLDQAGVPFWRTQNTIAPQLPDSDWKDQRHLNKDGAKLFSTWVAEEIAKQISPEIFR